MFSRAANWWFENIICLPMKITDGRHRIVRVLGFLLMFPYYPIMAISLIFMLPLMFLTILEDIWKGA